MNIIDLFINDSVSNLNNAIDSAIYTSQAAEKSNLQELALFFFDTLGKLPENSINNLENLITNDFINREESIIISIFKIKSAISKGGILKINSSFSQDGLKVFQNIFQLTIKESKFFQATLEKITKKMTPEIYKFANASEVIEIYLKYATDTYYKFYSDSSLLYQAAFIGNYELVEILLKKGAHCNSQNTNGETPLMIAAYLGHTHIVKLLLTYGADVSLKDDLGDTALKNAAIRGHLETLKELLPASTNLLNDNSWIEAKVSGQLEVAQALKDANLKTSFDRKWKNVKRLGHQFSWEGSINITNEEPKISISFDGMIDTGLWFNKMSKMMNSMIELPLRYRTSIQRTLLMAADSKTKNASNYLETFKKGKAIIIPTGWSTEKVGHSIEIVLVPPFLKGNVSYIFICNRGDKSNKAVEVFTFIGDKLTEKQIQALFNAREEFIESFNKKISTLSKKLSFESNSLTRDLEYKLSHLAMQTSGNCTWMNTEATVLVLMLALELRELDYFTEKELDYLFRRTMGRFELYGQRLRMEGVEKYINDILVTKKIEEFDSQLTFNSFVELWKLKIQNKDLLERLNELENLYMNHAPPLMQVFFKILKLESQDALHFSPDQLSTKEKSILKEGLISSEMKTYEKQIMRSITTGNVTIVETLLEAGFDPNTLCEGKYLLVKAAKIPNLTLIKLLLKYKADPNLAELDGKTALYWALYHDDLKLVELLIDKGAHEIADNLELSAISTTTLYCYYRLLTKRNELKAKSSPNQ